LQAGLDREPGAADLRGALAALEPRS
jgi:hypothetical protein